MLVLERDDYDLILGSSEDVFNYMKQDECFGLKRSECYDTPEDCYIAGLVNLNPQGKPFVFYNHIRLSHIRHVEDYYELLYHEAIHLAFELTREEKVQDEEQFIKIVQDMITYMDIYHKPGNKNY